jgi:hypothetical protein
MAGDAGGPEIGVSNRRFAVWAKRLRRRIKRLGISYDPIAIDGWESFPATFEDMSRKGYSGHNALFLLRAWF